MIDPVKPSLLNLTGTLISDEEATELSSLIFPLGNQWQEICSELTTLGYGLPSAENRAVSEQLASTEEGRSQLYVYWTEWAKERLAGLAGPINILRGNYPHFSAYRSGLIAKLRADLADGKLKSEGPIISPQFEPTVKRRLEMLPDCLFKRQVNEKIKAARQQAVAQLQLPDKTGFVALDERARYELLIERYSQTMDAAGFVLDLHRNSGLVFRKLTSDKRWAFLLIDRSREGVDTGGLSPCFALTLPQKAVLPSEVPLGTVATFMPDDIVPYFRSSCIFERDSYPQFSLAADSIAHLARIVYSRLDALLVAA